MKANLSLLDSTNLVEVESWRNGKKKRKKIQRNHVTTSPTDETPKGTRRLKGHTVPKQV